MSRFLYWEVPFPRDGGQSLALAAVRDRREGRAFSFSLFVDRRFAGIASLGGIDWRAGSGDLFYWLGAAYRNQGVGGWAVGQLVQWAQQGPGPNRRLAVLYANCLAENQPSLRILKKNGFREISQFLGSGDHGGKFAGRRWVRFARTLPPAPVGPPASGQSRHELVDFRQED